MAKYHVTETVLRSLTVEANSEEEARQAFLDASEEDLTCDYDDIEIEYLVEEV